MNICLSEQLGRVAGRVMEGGASGQEEETLQRGENGGVQKRRVYVFAATLACISFLLFSVDAIFSVAREMIRNDQVWKRIETLVNITRLSNVCTALQND